MNQPAHLSLSSFGPSAMQKHHVNWHEAAICALQIELRDYADLLDFQPEFILGSNSYRIDLLIIRKVSGIQIPKNIARIFKTCNLFEIKGLHSSVTASSYYKTIGYAGLFIDQNSGEVQYTSLDVSLTFLAFRFPRKLVRHLRSERNIAVEKISDGVYHINKETFQAQIIVIPELPPEENLYLRCLSDRLRDASLTDRLADDYTKHMDHPIYTNYLNQLAAASFETKGELPMVCEGILNLCGTSSEEIFARAKKKFEDYYLPQIDELSSQIEYLQNLLRQNNIPFELNAAPNEQNKPNQ